MPHLLSGVRGSCSVRSSMGSRSPKHPKPYQPQTLTPAFTPSSAGRGKSDYQSSQKIPWVWKPKWWLLSNLALSPEATGSLNRSQTATVLGPPGQGKRHTAYRPAAWEWSLRDGRQRWVGLLQGENRKTGGLISQQEPRGCNSSTTGSLLYS